MQSNRKTNRSKQVGGAYGFDQVSLDSHLPAECCTLNQVARGQHHDHYTFERWISADAAEHFYPIHPGHPFVEQKQAIGTSLGGGSGEFGKSGFPGITRVRIHPPLTSKREEYPSTRGVVINDQGGHSVQIFFTRDGRGWLRSR